MALPMQCTALLRMKQCSHFVNARSKHTNRNCTALQAGLTAMIVPRCVCTCNASMQMMHSCSSPFTLPSYEVT